ncbi:MAG TPA: hypothetical protein VGG72_01210 [Bryobacteraceae bacterium]
MKRIRLRPNVPAEIRAIDQSVAMQVLGALHRYAEAGEGDVKPLNGEFEGLLRLPPAITACFSKRPTTR